jgi:sugar transferase EpsL
MNSLTAKRVFDLVVVIVFLPVWLPLLGAVAAIVRVNLGRPVFFRQARPGLHGVVFELIKFRTMSDERDAEGKLRSDAERLSSFGRLLRSTSLDELPELLNVILGEMSLVGPRPLLTAYLQRYTVEQFRRHEAPPGLTGWAQINGRNGLAWDERFRLDVWYVDHRTLRLDVWILILTLWRVLARHGIAARGEATMSEFNPDTSTKS